MIALKPARAQSDRRSGSHGGDALCALLRPAAEAVEAALGRWLSDPLIPTALAEAMRYASLNGGKRIRPALVLFSADAVADAADRPADPMPAAVAVELVHCYSLVHDDLPAMDDDALRRGRPTCHVRYGEAMAILVGDALLTRAFEVLARGVAEAPLSARLTGELAAAAGPAGIIAGQAADMGLCDVPDGPEGLRSIHARKTGALIRAAVRMGAICAGAGEEALAALTAFGEAAGLAFQVTDDLLDATASAKILGKTPGKDAEAGKRNYVAALGIEPTRRLAADLNARAAAALEILGPPADTLRHLAALLSERDR